VKTERFSLASRRRVLYSLFGALFASLLASSTRMLASQPEHPFVIRSEVNRVLLDVSVKKRDGGYVTGLSKSDFRVFEEGRPQPILYFANVDTPVTVGLIVDNSGSMRAKRGSVVMAGLSFAKESNKQDEFFVVNFNDQVVPGLPPGVDFSDDLKTLRSALFMGTPAGQTALYDAIAYGLEHLRKGHQPKKTLIVVSDGGDNVSKTSASQILEMIRASQATIYTVGLFGPEDPDRNPGILQKMAHLSGGEYFNPTDPKDVMPVFHKIAVDIRNRYTLTYAPDPSLNPENHPVRHIRVEVHDPQYKKLIVRTRTSYSFKPRPAHVENSKTD
jgi:Ca-activated chloride channel homolog